MNESFVSGDTVKTINNEMDIELIPSCTIIVLTKPNGNNLWWGRCKINDRDRTVLVCSSNLKMEKQNDSIPRTTN